MVVLNPMVGAHQQFMEVASLMVVEAKATEEAPNPTVHMAMVEE